MLAELRLMRAFTYLRLVTWFGDVPFFTTNPTLPESRVVKVTPAATIKEFIHSELAEVAEILPKNTDIPESENGRYTRGTASMHVHTFMTTISRTAPSGATS